MGEGEAAGGGGFQGLVVGGGELGWEYEAGLVSEPVLGGGGDDGFGEGDSLGVVEGFHVAGRGGGHGRVDGGVGDASSAGGVDGQEG